MRVRGQSRLSCWFAFGFVFSDVASYTLEVNQNGHLWRTDAIASKDFSFTITSNQGSPYGELLDGDGDTVALGISVSGPLPLDQRVRQYLAQRQEKVVALLLLSKSNIQQQLQSAGEVVALADSVKYHIRLLTDHWDAKRLLLFYQGPLSGACFIGHKLNALHANIQIMEDQQPGYAPSFLLPR